MPIVATITRTAAGPRFFSQSPSNAGSTGGSAYALYKSDGTSMGGFQSVGQAIAFFNRAFGDRQVFRWERRDLPAGIEQHVCIGEPLDPREVYQKGAIPQTPPNAQGVTFLEQWIDPSFVPSSQGKPSFDTGIKIIKALDLSGNNNFFIGNFLDFETNDSFLGRTVMKLDSSVVVPGASGGYTLVAPFTLTTTGLLESGTQLIGSAAANPTTWWVGDSGGFWAFTYGVQSVISDVPTSEVAVLSLVATDTYTEFHVNGATIGRLFEVISDTVDYSLAPVNTGGAVYMGSMAIAKDTTDLRKLVRAERWMRDRFQVASTEPTPTPFNPALDPDIGGFVLSEGFADGAYPLTVDQVNQDLDATQEEPPILSGEFDFSAVSGGLRFDGVDEGVVLNSAGAIADLQGISDATGFSFSFWFTSSNATPATPIAVISSTTDAYSLNNWSGWAVYVENGSGKIAVEITTNRASASKGLWRTDTTYSDGTRHHVMISVLRNSINNYTVAIYIDGSSVAIEEVAVGIGNGDFNTADVVSIGCRGTDPGDVNGNSYPFDGDLLEIGVYSAALSSGDATTLYNGGDPLDLEDPSAPAGLQMYWPLDNVVFPNVVESLTSATATMLNMEAGDVISSLIRAFQYIRQADTLGEFTFFFRGTVDSATVNNGIAGTPPGGPRLYLNSNSFSYDTNLTLSWSGISGDQTLIFVRDATNVTAYRDGAIVAGPTAIALTTPNTGRIYLGRSSNTYLEGSSKAMGFYDRALSADEITQLNDYLESL